MRNRKTVDAGACTVTQCLSMVMAAHDGFMNASANEGGDMFITGSPSQNCHTTEVKCVQETIWHKTNTH